MSSIYYETTDGDVHQIDEVSQRILVYVYLHGRGVPEEMVETVDAVNEPAVHARVENQLGRNATGLVDTESETQVTLGDQPDTNIQSVVLTETGESFVEKHRGDMSMPADVAELAQKVAELQIEDHMVDALRTRIDELEERLEELEGRNR